MIKNIPVHFCDYCHKNLSDISPSEYLADCRVIRGRSQFYEFCSLSCLINFYLVKSRRKK